MVLLNRSIKHWLKICSGWFLLALGIVGLFLPVLQGIAFIVSGLAVLATEYEWARTWLNKAKSKLQIIRDKSTQSSPLE